MATGVVTTAGLADATPAAFLAHAGHREEYRTILEQLLTSNATVLIGGDWRRSVKAARQPDYLELVRDAEAVAGARFTVVRDAAALASAPAPLLALLPARPGSRSAHGPPLAESTRRALELLGDRAAGFLLVVEQEETDESAHDHDLDAVVAALAELDEALRVILEYAAARSDTLVVVTADHDTAGLAITDGDFDEGVGEAGLARRRPSQHLGAALRLRPRRGSLRRRARQHRDRPPDRRAAGIRRAFHRRRDLL